MKKTLLFAMSIAAITLVGCNKEEIESSSTSMTLTANVYEPQTEKATIDNSWKFSFEQGDVVKVVNTQREIYYSFTKGSSSFTSKNARTTSEKATWYAFFPSENFSLTGQTGTKDGAADHFGYAGAQENVPAETKSLNITMYPKMAIIVIDNQKGKLNISAKVSSGEYITGMTAATSGPSFEVSTSSAASNLLSVTSKGTYYVAVPTGVAFDVYDGKTKLKSVAADKLVAGNYYSLTVEAPALEGLYFEALEAGAQVEISGPEYPLYNLQYSTDGEWSKFKPTTKVTLSNVGDRVYIKASGSNSSFSMDSPVSQFVLTKNVKVGGDIMFLLDEEKSNLKTTIPCNYCFQQLFKDNTTLISAEDLTLSALTTTNSCYLEMFYGCTNLTSAPVISATTAADNSHSDMFRDCTNLTTAPKLNATTLGATCYLRMFYNCKKLSSVPDLEAKTLVNRCYQDMFAQCTDLTSLTILATEGYRSDNKNPVYGILGGVYNSKTGTLRYYQTTEISNWTTYWTNCLPPKHSWTLVTLNP